MSKLSEMERAKSHLTWARIEVQIGYCCVAWIPEAVPAAAAEAVVSALTTTAVAVETNRHAPQARTEERVGCSLSISL